MQSSCRGAAPGNHENAFGAMYAEVRIRSGKRADFPWCFELERQSGPDIAANPKLLPPERPVSTRSRLLVNPMSSRVLFGENRTMDTVYQRCAGLDVHKKTVVACLRRVESNGRVRNSVRTFGTMTCELL